MVDACRLLRQRLPVKAYVLHWHAARRNPLGCKPAPYGRGVDRSDLGDRGWIVGDVQTRPEADLEHSAIERRGNASTDWRQLAAAHDQLGETRNDLIPIDPHRESIAEFERQHRRITGQGVTRGSYTCGVPSKHPRIAVTSDSELASALERVRVATGTREADATLVRRLAVEGARAELEVRDQRRAAAEALMLAMDDGEFDLDLDAIDRLNQPADPAS